MLLLMLVAPPGGQFLYTPPVRLAAQPTLTTPTYLGLCLPAYDVCEVTAFLIRKRTIGLYSSRGEFVNRRIRHIHRVSKKHPRRF